tara:strand:- start:548 stop:1354 length:807 start_codon:yes stop_codon:yes gene_type:complete
MPSFSQKAFNSYWKRIFQISQTTNTGADGTTRNVETGDGRATSINLSDDVFSVKPVDDDSVGTMLVKNTASSNILAVDTTNSKVLVGASQVAASTHYKEFGFYQLDQQAGYHVALIAGNMLIGNDDDTNWSADESMFGNGTDPLLVVDASDAQATCSNLAAVIWYIEDNITIDSARFIANATEAAGDELNFHLMSYTFDNTTNFGDLSAGAVIMEANTTVSTTQVKHGTFANVGSVDVDAGKVMVCTVENVETTAEVTAQVIVKYHTR